MIKLDSHVDILHQIFKPTNKNVDLSIYRDDLQIDIPRLLEGEINSLFFALFIKQNSSNRDVRIKVGQQYELFLNLLRHNSRLNRCFTPNDILQTLSHNRIAVTLALENAFPIEFDLDFLSSYKEMGIRYITLCHNKSNQICDSSTDILVHNGLSDFGKSVVKEMNKLGLMIDISHVSDKTVEDILEITELPIIASHSNSYSVWNNPRNLNNELLEKIAKNNGVSQVNLLPKCVGGDQNLLSFLNHVDYIVKLIGIDHVGFGSDFDGGGGLTDCNNISETVNITQGLEDRGYSQEEIEKFWGLNFLRVYSENYGD